MSESIVLNVSNLTKKFGGLTAVNEVNFRLAEGETLGIIGPNGAGKTTLFNLLTGVEHADRGKIEVDGKDISGFSPEERAELRLARTFQHGRVFGNMSVLDNVLIGAHIRRQSVRTRLSWLGPFKELVWGLGGFSSHLKEEVALKEEVLQILTIFGERLLPRVNEPAYSLSYANRRRVEIARALALKPRILFLDEPTAGMNPAETEEMLEILLSLKQTGLTMVIIEHKLPLIIPVSHRIIVMDEGQKIAEGDPLQVSWEPQVIQAYLGKKTVYQSKGNGGSPWGRNNCFR